MSSSITLLNQTSYDAEFRVLQGTDQVARIGVHPKAEADVPTGNSYQVQAVTSMGDFTLKSNIVSFEATSAHLLAKVQMTDPSLYDFQLNMVTATEPSAIVLENTWRSPVTFNILKDGSPMAIVRVVDEHNTDKVSTAQQWEVYAIINGITTTIKPTNNPSADVTALQDNNDDGFFLQVT